MSRRPDVDVLVVGGGPVGLSAAIDARMAGLTVCVIEPRFTGHGSARETTGGEAVDKACGEGLMPGAVPALSRLGIDPPGFALRGVSYRSGTGRSERRVDHLFATGVGRGVRRTALHTALRQRAEQLGVQFVGSKITALTQDSDTVSVSGGGAPLRGRYLLGADGLHSTIRRLAGLERPAYPAPRRFGLRQHFFIEPESELIEVYWTPTVEAYLTPVGDGVVGIALLARRDVGRGALDFSTALAAVPGLSERVRGAEPASTLRGAGPFRQRTSARVRGRVMLVGDASGYVDAITGEGIRVGLAQAQAAIECVVADDPQAYERQWARRTRDFRMLTAGLVAAANSPLRPAIVPAAAALPRLFGAVVERLAR